MLGVLILEYGTLVHKYLLFRSLCPSIMFYHFLHEGLAYLIFISMHLEIFLLLRMRSFFPIIFPSWLQLVCRNINICNLSGIQQPCWTLFVLIFIDSLGFFYVDCHCLHVNSSVFLIFMLLVYFFSYCIGFMPGQC